MKHSSSFERITPEIATQYLTFNTRNRAPRTSHVDYLANEIRAGRFMPTVDIHMANVAGEWILINGQHTLMAIVKAKKTMELNVTRSTSCEEEDLLRLYAATDIQRRRTFADAAAAYELPARSHLTPSTINRIAAALRHMKNNFGVKTAGGEENQIATPVLFEHVPRWAHEAQLIDNAISPCTKKMRSLIFKASIFSVCLVTAYYQPEKARSFWQQVAQDDGLLRSDPRKVLNKYLPETIGTPRGPRAPLPSLQSRMAILCWNAFFEGNTLERVTRLFEMTKQPVCILGTPFNGKQAGNYYPHREPEHEGKNRSLRSKN